MVFHKDKEVKKKLLKSILAITLSITSLEGISQYGYPLNSYSGPEDPIELGGSEGDPEFVLWCLKSEFGQSTKLKVDSTSIPTAILAEWNVNRKEWSIEPFTLRFHSAVHSGGGLNLLRMYISCNDAKGNDLLAGRSHSSDEIRKALQTLLFQSTRYVNSSNGLNVRKHPSLSAPVIFKLTDEGRVLIKEGTNQWINIVKGNESIKTEWVKIFVNENVYGYVPAAFLLPSYEVHPNDIKALNDSIFKFVEIELVDYDTYIKQKIVNPYAINKEDLSIKAKPYMLFANDSTDKRNAFYLPIANGGDSLYLHGSQGEYGGNDIFYYGRIPKLHQYVVQETGYFFNGYVLYDMRTGKQSLSCNGLPNISPDGKFLLDFYHYEESEDWDYPHFCKISIRTVNKVNDSIQFVKQFHCLDSNPHHYLYFSWDEATTFWISDNELVIQIVKERSFNVQFTDYRNDLKSKKAQYVKLKIKT